MYPIFSALIFNLIAVLLKSNNLKHKFNNALNIFTNKHNKLKPNTIKALILLKLGY